MRLETESELVQNSALGAALLLAFVVEFVKNRDQEHGPPLPFVLPILPMVMHEETVKALHRRQKEGGLDLALAQHRTLSIDLQERMEAMMPQTMQALNVAFSAKLLSYNRERSELFPMRGTIPFQGEEIRRMANTARRLGYWFCTINSERLFSLLRVKF